MKCPCCKGKLTKPYVLKRSKSKRKEIRYQCNKRKCSRSSKSNSVSLKKYTWFDGSKLTLQKSLFITYCFVYQLNYKDTIRETSIDIEERQNEVKQLTTSMETVTDYKRYCRDVCFNVVLDESSDKIGGVGKTVEIDESKFGKMKYHKGRKIEGQWVFGGICREDKTMFLYTVEKRDKSHLIPIIKSRIAEGTTIISDCWATYKCLEDEGFKHLTVNHSYNFVDPTTLAHTQNIENLWWQIKRQLPETYSRHDQLYLHLSEYMWRILRSGCSDLFVTFLQDASQYFNGTVCIVSSILLCKKNRIIYDIFMSHSYLFAAVLKCVFGRNQDLTRCYPCIDKKYYKNIFSTN